MFRPWEDHTNQCTDNELVKKRSSTYNQLDLNDVLSYVIKKMYPPNITTKNDKSNFRKQCKPYTVNERNKLYYKKKTKNILFEKFEEKLIPVVTEESEQKNIIMQIHQGTDSCVE